MCMYGTRIGNRFNSYLSDSLAVLATVQDSPGDAAGVLALEEEGLGLSVLETEDLGVAADVELTLQSSQSQHFCTSKDNYFAKALPWPLRDGSLRLSSHGSCVRLLFLLLPVRPIIERSTAIQPAFLGEISSSYLARVDSLARECVVVGPHFEWRS